jgi:carbon-monoxide dehydrogenase medium subunit
MITAEITFHRPASLSEVLELLARHGDEAKLLGGGMSLLPTMTLGLARPEILVSLNHVPELREIREDGDHLRIGGTVRHVDLLESPLVAQHAPLLAETARHIGDVQVRNRGTVGGSVAHADPAADYLPALVALEASVVAKSQRGERVIPAGEFFVDVMATAIEPGELISEIRVPKQGPARGAYRRLARVEGSFAIVNAAAVVRPGGQSTVAIGGIAGSPIVVDASGAVAAGLSPAALAELDDAVRAACGEPFEDLNGDAEYRREMAVVHARRALLAAAGSVAGSAA